MSSFSHIDPCKVPQHIAIIMDGNGRWAQQQGKERAYGHMMGIESVRRVIKAATQARVRYLTLYTFSEDNWGRPQEEIKALMGLLVSAIEKELPELIKQGVRLRAIGNLQRLPLEAHTSLMNALNETSHNDRLDVILALSYSSKEEILQACKSMVHRTLAGGAHGNEWTEESLREMLYTRDIPDPDLMIRTGGEQRLSNFLLWQSAYTELYFCETFWPEFDEEGLYDAISDYQQRQRRFGKTAEQVCCTSSQAATNANTSEESTPPTDFHEP